MNRANRPRLSRISGSSYASKLLGRAGDGSTLTLDFTTGVLDPRLTFTRDSNATFINSSGLVKYAFSNRIPNSASLSGFTATGVTATADPNEPGPVIAPSGTQATKVTVNGGATTVNFNRNFGTGAGTSTGMTYSIYLKPSRLNNGSGFRYMIRNETTALNTYGVDVVWANSPVTVSEVIGAADGDYQLIGPDANGWYRLILMVTNTGLIRPGDNLTVYAGYSGQGTGFFDASGAYWVWGAQLEPGLTASPVYLTGATSTGYFDVPRFDHDPTTGSPRGLLIEGSATNLASYSEDFSNAAWTKSGTNGSMTLTGTAPDNNATSRLLEENTTSYAKHSLERSISISAGIHTLSVWLKEPSANSRRYAHIQLADGQATAARYTIVADLQAGTITASGANNGTAGAPTGTGHSITPYPNGWYRVTISMNHVASPSYPVIMLGDSASLFGGNNQPFYSATTPYKGLLVWGAQLETGSGASSYIPTGASQGTRNADNCAITGGNFTTWFNSSAGTLLVSARTATRYVDSAGFDFPAVLTLDSNSHIGPCQWNGVVYGVVRVGGSYRINYATLASPGNNATYKAAIAYADSDFAAVANGGTIQTGSGTTVPSGLNQLALGTSRGGVAGNFFGHISQIKFWPTRLPNAQLQSLTT